MPNMTKNRERWRTQVERLLATDMAAAERCKVDGKSEPAMFRRIGRFADHEPELFGGAANIADRDGCEWVTKTRESMRASAALATPAREAPGAFIRIDAAELAAGPAKSVSCRAGPAITVALNGAEAAFEPSAPEPEAEEAARPRRKRKRRECVGRSEYGAVVVEHGLEGEGASCPACGSQTEGAGYRAKRVFKICPAHVYVEGHRQRKGACRECGGANEADGGETPVQIVKAGMPEVAPVEGSRASASLVACILGRRCCLGLPVCRMAADLRAPSGLTVTRQAMAGQAVKSWQRRPPLVLSRMRARAMEPTVLRIDETRMQVLKEPGGKPTDMSWARPFCTPA